MDHKKDVDVADVVNWVRNYFDRLKGNKEIAFGTIIARYDSIKKVTKTLTILFILLISFIIVSSLEFDRLEDE